MGSIIACVVQSVYAYRIFCLYNRSPYFPIALEVVSLLALAFSLVVASNLIQVGNVQNLTTYDDRWKIVTSFILPAAVDLSITLAMLWKFRDYHRRGSSQGTGRIIKRLMLFTIETNAFTSIYCIVFVIVYLTTGSVYILLLFSLAPIYTITLIVNLDSRSGTQRTLNGGTFSSTGAFQTTGHRSSVYSIGGSSVMARSESNRPGPAPANGVKVETERAIDMDRGLKRGDEYPLGLAMVTLPTSVDRASSEVNTERTYNFQPKSL